MSRTRTREQSPACHTTGVSTAQHPFHKHASKHVFYTIGASKAQQPFQTHASKAQHVCHTIAAHSPASDTRCEHSPASCSQTCEQSPACHSRCEHSPASHIIIHHPSSTSQTKRFVDTIIMSLKVNCFSRATLLPFLDLANYCHQHCTYTQTRTHEPPNPAHPPMYTPRKIPNNSQRIIVNN